VTKILSVATHATDDPTKCTLAFVTVAGALGAGKEVALALLGEAVYVTKPGVPAVIQGVGMPPLTELIDKIVAAKVTEEDIKSLNGTFITAAEFASLVAEHSVVSF
jgi:predicted peroxiredoxin